MLTFDSYNVSIKFGLRSTIRLAFLQEDIGELFCILIILDIIIIVGPVGGGGEGARRGNLSYVLSNFRIQADT